MNQNSSTLNIPNNNKKKVSCHVFRAQLFYTRLEIFLCMHNPWMLHSEKPDGHTKVLFSRI
jgi:hypothetical protein